MTEELPHVDIVTLNEDVDSRHVPSDLNWHLQVEDHYVAEPAYAV